MQVAKPALGFSHVQPSRSSGARWPHRCAHVGRKREQRWRLFNRYVQLQDKDVLPEALRKGVVDYSATSDEDDFGDDDVSLPRSASAAAASVGIATYECVRIIPSGRATKLFLKRRDLLRSFSLAPRDLRRIDPNLSFTRSSPVLTIKDNVLLVQLSGVRLIITAQSALLLDPRCRAARQYLGQVVPKLQVSTGQRLIQEVYMSGSVGGTMDDNGTGSMQSHSEELPFELEILEAALNLAVGKLDNELIRAQERVQTCLQKLPRDISPANLDDLRRIKGTLVELESASDAYRQMLEDIMDDEDELKEINLSSRVQREDRRKARERERLEREMARERGEQDLRRKDGGASTSGRGGGDGLPGGSDGGSGRSAPSTIGDTLLERSLRHRRRAAQRAAQHVASPEFGKQAQQSAAALEMMSRVQRDVVRGFSERSRDYPERKDEEVSPYKAWERSIDGLATKHPNIYPDTSQQPLSSSDDGANLPSAIVRPTVPGRTGKPTSTAAEPVVFNFDGDKYTTTTQREAETHDPLAQYSEVDRPSVKSARSMDDNADFRNPVVAPSPDYWHDVSTIDLSVDIDTDGYIAQMVESEAQMELREMEEAEEEEQELQEVEDLLEFYLQRATSIQTEAERLLAGARDLEESIGLALSARRFEVNRLELQLSIGGFAAALGAMVAGIFGMNLKSTLEESVLGFWGTTIAIVAGCVWVYIAIMRWTKTRKILT